jgi:hypothetical protein
MWEVGQARRNTLNRGKHSRLRPSLPQQLPETRLEGHDALQEAIGSKGGRDRGEFANAFDNDLYHLNAEGMIGLDIAPRAGRGLTLVQARLRR